MQGFIFPAYLKDADKKHLTQLVFGIKSSKPAGVDLLVRVAIDWLWEKKVVASINELPGFSDGKFPEFPPVEAAWGYLKWELAIGATQAKKFVALMELHGALHNQIKGIYGDHYSADELMQFGSALFLSHPLTFVQERTLVELLQAPMPDLRSEEDYLRMQYLGMLIDAGTKKLQCCLDLARAGVSSLALLKIIENTLLAKELEVYLIKIDIILALPSASSKFMRAKEAIINVLKSSYLQAVSEAYTDEESQYVHKLRCYQKLLGSDLPLEYIAHTLKDMRQIYLSERCFDAFATAVFSARSEEANGLRVSLVMRITDMVWKSAEIKVKLTWLRCLARADEKSIIGPFLREKLNSLPDIDLPLQGAYHPAISGLANGGAGVAVSSHAPGGSPSP